MAVGFDQNLEFRVRRAARAGDAEVDLDQHRGAANAHGRDRRIDFHVAVLGGLAGDERDGAGHQADQRGIVRPVRVVDHLVEHHPRIRREAEHGAIDEGDADRRIGAGLDDVAFFDVFAIVQDDRDAVTDRGRAADELGDVADHLGGIRRASGLGNFDVTGQCVDDVAGELGAVGRGECRALLALEVVVQDQLVVVLGKHQVDAGPLEIAVEQQLGVRHDNRIGRNVGRVVRKSLDVGVRIWMRARTVHR